MLTGSTDATAITGGTTKLPVITIIMAGMAAQSLIFSVPPPALPHMALVLGARGATVAQLLFVLPSLGLMLAGLVSGWLISRFGLRRCLLGSFLVYGVTGSLPVVTINIFALLSSRLLLGVACAVLSTSCTTLLAQRYAGEARARMLGYQSAAGSVTGVVALILAGEITGLLGWRTPFWLYALPALPLLLLAALTLREAPPAARAQAEKQGGVFTALRLLWPVYLAGCLLFTIPMASGGALPFLLQQRGVTQALTQSLVISAFAVFSATGAFLYGHVRARLGAWASFTLGVALSGGGMLLIGAQSNLLLTATGNGIAGLGLGFFVPHLWSVATDALPANLRGRAVGLFNSAMFLGGFTSAFIVGALNSAFGRAGAFSVIGILTLAFAVGLMFLRRNVIAGVPAEA